MSTAPSWPANERPSLMKSRLAVSDTFEMEAAESATSLALVPALPPRRPKAVSLKSLGAVRREIQRVYSDVRQGRLPSQEGTRLTYILAQAGRILEISVIEDRLIALEKRGNQ